MRVLIIGIALCLIAACSSDNGKSDDVGPDVTDTAGDLAQIDATDLGPDEAVIPDVVEDELAPPCGDLGCEDQIDVEDVLKNPDIEGVELPDIGQPDLPDVQFEIGEEVEEIGGEIEPESIETEVVEPAPCVLDFDCEPGHSCKLGFCVPVEPECETADECGEEQVCLDGVCLDEGTSPLVGKLVINELLSDGDTDEDANDDGTIDSMEDEFVELVNVSNEAVDMSGWILADVDWDTFLPRHTFPNGFALEPMEVLVIFGGGDPPESGDGIVYLAANAQDPGIPYGLDLDDEGDLLRLLDENGLVVAILGYGDGAGIAAVSDESLTRDPDLTGDFTPHTMATDSEGVIFSPGTKNTGEAF